LGQAQLRGGVVSAPICQECSDREAEPGDVLCKVCKDKPFRLADKEIRLLKEHREEVRASVKVPSSPPEPSAILPSPPDLASDQHILDRFTETVTARGLVGERRLARLTYMVITSRLLDRPVSLAVKGPSSGGKSYTVEQTTEFFPPAALHALTGMSERALIYDEEPVKHRTILLYEYVALKTGMEEDQTSYYIRSLLSEGVLRYQVTERVDGRFKTRIIEREGPTNLIVTTTAVKLHDENETRAFSVTIDDTREQTRRIMQRLADDSEATGALRDWHDLQTWLQEAGEPRVFIPYAPALADAVPPIAVRLRRDFGSVLSLIKAHAILHQLSRDRDQFGRIVATLEDYEVVRDLVGEIVAEGVGATVPSTMRETVDAVAALGDLEGVNAAAVGRELNLDASAARRRLLSSASRGFIRNLEDRPRRPGRYVLGESMPEETDVLPPSNQLPTANLLEGRETAGQTEDGTMASESEGVEGNGQRASGVPDYHGNGTPGFPGVIEAIRSFLEDFPEADSEDVSEALGYAGPTVTVALARIRGEGA
jgi:hypothetical protein